MHERVTIRQTQLNLKRRMLSAPPCIAQPSRLMNDSLPKMISPTVAFEHRGDIRRFEAETTRNCDKANRHNDSHLEPTSVTKYVSRVKSIQQEETDLCWTLNRSFFSYLNHSSPRNTNGFRVVAGEALGKGICWEWYRNGEEYAETGNRNSETHEKVTKESPETILDCFLFTLLPPGWVKKKSFQDNERLPSDEKL